MAKPSKIVVMTGGSRGDIQPFIAVASGLKDAGYQVKLLSCINHEAFVKECGIDFAACFPDAEEEMRNNDRLKEAMAKGDVLKYIPGVSAIFKKHNEFMITTWYKEITEYKPDLIIEGSMTDYYGAFARYKLGIPVLDLKLQLLPASPKRMFWGFPSMPCGLNGLIMRKIILGGLYDAWVIDADPHCLNLLGYKVTDAYTKAMYEEDVTNFPIAPKLVGQPDLFRGLLYEESDLPSNVRLIGQIVIRREDQVNLVQVGMNGNFGTMDGMSRISAFIAAGSKPVYMGWGSMVCHSSGFMVEFVSRALRASGMRAIIQTGWAGLSLDMLQNVTQDQALIDYMKKNAFFVDKLPHEWLFPQCVCLVHHGGAGTLGCALRAGVPQVVTPVFTDQWDHAYLINKLGVGIGFDKTQFQNLNAEQLGDAIKMAAANQQFFAKASEVSAAISAQDGTAFVVNYVDQFWKEHVESGRLKAAVASRLKANAIQRTFWQRLGRLCCSSV